MLAGIFYKRPIIAIAIKLICVFFEDYEVRHWGETHIYTIMEGESEVLYMDINKR